jgi:hypothetical protein
MRLNFKKNKIIIYILILFIGLGILWLIANALPLKEGNVSRDQELLDRAINRQAQSESGQPPPEDREEDGEEEDYEEEEISDDLSQEEIEAEGQAIETNTSASLTRLGLDPTKFKTKADILLKDLMPALKSLQKSITDGSIEKMFGVDSPADIPVGGRIDTTDPTGSKTFFTGGEANDGFCQTQTSDPQELTRKCSSLTMENCNSTDCCIVLGGNKCVAGDETGPTFKTDNNGTDIDYAYYSYKNECFGSCGQGIKKSANPCSAFNDDDTNVSAECLTRLWQNTGCPNTAFMDAEQVEKYKDYTKSSIKTTLKFAKNEENYESCYGATQTSWPAPCSGTTETSFGLTKRCMAKLFNDAGCPYTTTVNDVLVAKNNVVPKSAIVQQFMEIKAGNDDNSILQCYGPDRTTWPNPCLGVPEEANIVNGTFPRDCAKKIYRDAMTGTGCTSTETIDTVYSDYGNLPILQKEHFFKHYAGIAPVDVVFSKAWFTKSMAASATKESIKANNISCNGFNPNNWPGVTKVLPDPCRDVTGSTLINDTNPQCLRRIAAVYPNEKCPNVNKGSRVSSYLIDGGVTWDGAVGSPTIRDVFNKAKNDYLMTPKRKDMTVAKIQEGLAVFYKTFCNL